MTNRKKVVVGFMAGLAVGTIIGILIAPDKGKNTRNNITKKTNQFRDDVNSSIQKGVGKVNSIKESAFTLVNKYGNGNELTDTNSQSMN
ncbi:MAG: YtxH domain-containing protein [Cytophagaceae bacterium]